MSDVTRILAAIDRGDPHAAAQLLPLVYEELRKLAAARMAAERPDHTLTATALVHEAYLRLVGGGQPDGWAGRGHFFAAAAEAMRRILVEAARRKARVRHGGGRQRVPLADDLAGPAGGGEDVVAVSEALDRLADADPQAAELVKLHFFAGLTVEQAAAALGVSARKGYAVWAYARAWLFRALGGRAPAGG
jgi:RNA polymerase sigma factor (TIGR02999 family)